MPIDEFIIFDEVMMLIRTLAKKLSALKQFRDFVMAEAIIERGAFQPSLEVEHERKNLAVIRLSDQLLALTVKLLMPCGAFFPTRPPTKKPLRVPLKGTEQQTQSSLQQQEDNRPRSKFLIRKPYSTEEVTAFIEEVDDENEIHRGARPIVPGFLIIETLLDDPRLIDCKKIRLRFKRFTSVDENLYLTVDGARFYVDADERKIEGWILDS